jgi:CHAT domain-containing protein
MKLSHLILQISLISSSIIVFADSVLSQTGNMSDITGPNPIEVIPNEPSGTDNTPVVEPEPNIDPNPSSETPTQPEIVENSPNAETPTQPETETPVVENPPNAETPTQPETETPVVENPPNAETPTQPNIKSPSNSNQDNLAETNEENLTSETDSETETNTTGRSNQGLTKKEETDTSTDSETEENEEVAEQEKKSEENSENNEEQSDFEGEIDRLAYEVQIQQSSPEVAIQLQEELQATQLVGYSGTQLYGQTPSVQEISQRLGQLWQQTGKKAAFINISVQSNQLEAFAVLPSLPESASNSNSAVALNKNNGNKWSQPRQPLALRRTTHETSRQTVLDTAKQFRAEIGNSRTIGQTDYLKTSQQLYQWLIAPLEAELKANQIDVLVFSMDSGLRLIPIAALYDGKQFLIEKYAVALVPSFGLTDTRYIDVSQSPILAMGASKFKDQFPLPTMPIELRNVISNPRQGELFLNEQFTVDNFKTQNLRDRPFKIIHLGTHAEFLAGDFQDSYIQFYDQKLKLPELREISDELGWNTTQSDPIELLVLSACQTAIGNEKAELGFAGLAVQAGVKSALASLWYVSDLGTLALMSEFYDELSGSLIKAEALRQTQLKMLKGEVAVDNGKLKLSNGDSFNLPPELPKGNLNFSHPYFWSSFTLVGNWN